MKVLIAMDALLAYPDHNKPFEIEMDSLDYQLGGVIKQEGRPMAYYSRKLIAVEKNYTTIEKESWLLLKSSNVFGRCYWVLVLQSSLTIKLLLMR